MLILLHGFTGDPSAWDDVRLPLRDDVLCPALLGHGASEPEVRTFEEEIDRVARLVEERGFEGAHVAGYSLGARVALGMLVRHPELVSSATLIGVNPGIEIEAERAERVRADEVWARLLEEQGIERFALEWEALPLFATQSPEQKASERARRMKHDPRELARSLRVLGLGAMPNYWGSLAFLGMPIRLMAGGRDTKFASIAERMLPRLSRGSITIVPDAGHNVVLEDPAAVRASLESE